MSVLVIAIAAGGAVSLLGIAAFLLLRRGDKGFLRRLQRAATPLADRAATDDTTAETDIFRSADTRSRSARLWRAVESRYPLLNARRTLPRAIAIGAVAATGLWFSMWFLKIPSGWWTIPLVGLGGVAAAWYAMSWFQTRQATEFTHQFPEVIDQIVRLSGAGVPPLEAIAVVAEDTRPPVQPVLRWRLRRAHRWARRGYRADLRRPARPHRRIHPVHRGLAPATTFGRRHLVDVREPVSRASPAPQHGVEGAFLHRADPPDPAGPESDAGAGAGRPEFHRAPIGRHPVRHRDRKHPAALGG